MNYAIKELRDKGRSFKNVNILKEYSDECFKVANALEENKFIKVSDEIITDLLDVYKRVCNGLNNWNKGYSNEKKRQEKKKKELEEAINFLKPKCDYCSKTEICKGSYPEGCFLENQNQKK